MIIATNCSNTRNRISFWDRSGEPAPHHVDETKQQHERDGSKGDRKNDGAQE